MPLNGGLSTAEAKRKVIDLRNAGESVKDSMKAVDRTEKTYYNWTANDPAFKSAIERIKSAAHGRKERGAKRGWMPFADWRREYLDQETYYHQLVWVDVIEGREPDIRPGITYEANDPNRIVINVPPFHAKSSTITVEYVVYRICMDPNVRIMIVSKTQTLAKKFLYAVKLRLTSNQWAKLQADFAPDEGFQPDRADGASWGAERIYVRGIDSGAPDPTVEALGIGGHIYGTRADLIIMDDCVTLDNAGQWDKQITWIDSEVDNRIEPESGKLLLIGTRLSHQDLYSEIRDPERYIEGVSPWTYVSMPMVLEFAEKPDDWVTLWPYSTRPLGAGTNKLPNGLYEVWTGRRAHKERSKRSATVWSLVYQQMDVPEDAVFPAACVRGSVNGKRKAGPLRAGAYGHPRLGAEGHLTVMSIDPAGTGKAFVMVASVDRKTNKRYVHQCWVAENTTPAWYMQRIASAWPEYQFKELIIESNAYASWIIYDLAIREFCATRGIKISPHFTQANKQDPDFGVASMATMFGSLRRSEDGAGKLAYNNDALIELPDPASSEGVRALIDQLIVWRPGVRGGKLVQDGPMALWFADLRFRDLLHGQKRKVGSGRQSVFSNSFSFGRNRTVSLNAIVKAREEATNP